jgi:hypothetical protein
MKSSGMQLKGYCVHIFPAMAIISFSIFLHPAGPMAFLCLAIFNPLKTFSDTYSFIQTITFWVGIIYLCAGLIGLLHAGYQYLLKAIIDYRLRKKQPILLDNEDNWIFL